MDEEGADRRYRRGQGTHRTRSARAPKGHPQGILGVLATLCLAMLIGVVNLAAAGPALAETTDRLRVGIVSPIDTLNPLLVTTPAAEMLQRQQYERVVGRGIGNEVVPGLASEWSTSPDGRSWTYTFPADRRWSDGEPLTAADAAWTLERIADDPILRETYAALLSSIGAVEAPTPTSLVITLVEPQAENPAAGLVVLPEHALSDADLSDRQLVPTVGSGPFVLASEQAGEDLSAVELIRNDHFWRGPAGLAGLEFVRTEDAPAAAASLEAGDLDFVSELSAEAFESLVDKPAVGTHVGTGRSYVSLIINPGLTDTSDKPFGDGNESLRDPLVRQAVQWSIDQEALIRQVLRGYGEPGLTLIPPVYPEFSGLADGAQPYEFDLARATELLDSAGYLRGEDRQRIGLDGSPLTFRLLTDAADPAQALIAEEIGDSLERLGIGLEVESLSRGEVGERVAAGQYDLYLGASSVGPDPDQTLLINTCQTRRSPDAPGSSEAGYCNSEFDQLYLEQHTSLDESARADLVREALSTSYVDAVIRPLYYPQQLEAYRSDRFTGFQPQPAEGGTIAFQNSYWGFYSVAPVLPDAPPGEVAPTPSSQRLRTGLLVGAVIVVAAGAAAWVAVRRRRRTGSA